MPAAFWHHFWALGFFALWQPILIVIVDLVMLGYLYLAIGPAASGRPKEDQATGRQIAMAAAMMAVCYINLGSPLNMLTYKFFSIHMVGAVLDTMVMAPLFVLALPRWVAKWCLRFRPVDRIWRVWTHPGVALLGFALVFALWHIQPFFRWTIVSDPMHYLGHATLFWFGVAFWWPVLSPLEDVQRLPELWQLAYLFAAGLVFTPLFYYLVFSGTSHYLFYVTLYHQTWGLASAGDYAFRDQQYGGIIMKLAMLAVMGSAFVVAFFRWWNKPEEVVPQNVVQLPRGDGYRKYRQSR